MQADGHRHADGEDKGPEA